MPAGNVTLRADTECFYPFRDVDPGAWYADSVYAACHLGLMRGEDQSCFAPDAGVTLAEAVTLAARLHSALAEDGETFDPWEDEPWYAPYADYALERGIIDQEYDYAQPATRDDFVHILASALSVQELELLRESPIFADGEDAPHLEDAQLLYQAGIINGIPLDDGLCFLPQSPILRAEAAAIITRTLLPELRTA